MTHWRRHGAGVDAALIHPPSSLPKNNATAIAAAKAHSGNFAILGCFTIDKSENGGLAATWKQQTGWRAFVLPLINRDSEAG
jgi:hypothetical protein